MKTLECSSAGDKRFSAFYAKVMINDKLDTIENHYQSCKKFDGSSKGYKKGKIPRYIKIGKHRLETKYLTPWYKILWLVYLDDHPELVRYASKFDRFTDKFRGKSINCQADVIEQYVKHGRESILNEPMVQELLELL